jgi:hypothetical protein
MYLLALELLGVYKTNKIKPIYPGKKIHREGSNNGRVLKHILHTRHPQHILALENSLCLAPNRSKIPPSLQATDQKLLIHEDCPSSGLTSSQQAKSSSESWKE